MISRIVFAIRNWRAHLRALVLGHTTEVEVTGVSTDGKVTVNRRLSMESTLSAVLHRGLNRKWWQKKTVDLGVLGRRVITTAGVNYLRDDFASGANDINTMRFHDCGTGNTAEAIGDTALVTPYGGARTSGSQDNSVSKRYRTVGTISFTSTLAIVEHGLFSASTVGTLWDRTVHGSVAVVNGDSITYTYDLTINDGG